MAVCYRYPDGEKCANCGWNMKTTECLSALDIRANELPIAEREILASWLPTNSLKNQPVCRECVHILNELVKAPRPVARELGHSSVCAACGDSITKMARRRCQPVDLTRPELNYLFTECMKQQVQDAGRDLKVCRPCVQQAKRGWETKGRKKNPAVATKSDTSTAIQIGTSQPKDKSDTKRTRSNVDAVASTSKNEQATENEEEEKGKEFIDENGRVCRLVKEITLEGKYNVRGKIGTCTVCNKPANQIMKLVTRQKLMMDRDIYINPSATFCREHLRSSVSRWPLNKDEWFCKFNGEEASDMLFLLQREIPLDFNKIEKIDPYYLEKYLRTDLYDFEYMLKRNPVLRKHPDGKFILAVWLASKRNSDSTLASLTQRPIADVTAAKLLAEEAMSKKKL